MRSLFALLPAIRQLSNLPILAAGAVSDAKGLQAARALGAEGVLVGTRFYASAEALAAPEAKQRIVQANGDSTLRTTVFDVVRGYDWKGITGRALRNAFSETWHGREQELRRELSDEAARYRVAVERRDFDTAVIFAGEGVDLIDSVLPARDIVRRICG